MLAYEEFVAACTAIAPELVPEMAGTTYTNLPVLLIVDDAPYIQGYLRRALRHAYEVEVAASIAQALQILDRRRVHLVLTDISMPGSNGLVLFDRVGLLYPEIPVIFMTGWPESPLYASARSRTRHVLAKPFQIYDLERTLRTAMHGSAA